MDFDKYVAIATLSTTIGAMVVGYRQWVRANYAKERALGHLQRDLTSTRNVLSELVDEVREVRFKLGIGPE